MREARPRPLCDQRERLHFDLHIIQIARPRYQTKKGPSSRDPFLFGNEQVLNLRRKQAHSQPQRRMRRDQRQEQP